MDLLDSKTDAALMASMVGEIAKARNEIKCAEADIAKANSRIGFLLVVVHKLIERQGDK